MPFTPTEFVDKPSTSTPVTAAELNKLGTGLQDATTKAETALSRALPAGGSATQIPVKTGPNPGDVAWSANTAASVLSIRQVGGVYPALPATRPAGTTMVQAIGVDQPTPENMPSGIPAWVGKGASQAPLVFEAIPGLA